MINHQILLGLKNTTNVTNNFKHKPHIIVSKENNTYWKKRHVLFSSTRDTWLNNLNVKNYKNNSKFFSSILFSLKYGSREAKSYRS